jgi:stage III sporulation protein AG
VVIKEILPEVKGVIVVAEGASNIEVRESLTRAVQVLSGVAVHKIQVFVKSK